MKIATLLVLLQLSHFDQTSAFSPDLCRKLCSVSDTLCWLCNSVHGSDHEDQAAEAEIEEQLRVRPVTKAEMIQKAKYGYSRQQKIVGGMPVEQGESPWTVR